MKDLKITSEIFDYEKKFVKIVGHFVMHTSFRSFYSSVNKTNNFFLMSIGLELEQNSWKNEGRRNRQITSNEIENYYIVVQNTQHA